MSDPVLTSIGEALDSEQVIQDKRLEADPLIGKVEMTEAQFRVYVSTAKITLAIAGVRGGKTHVGALKMLHYAMTHPCAEDEVHLVLSPTYPMSRVPIEKMFKLLFDLALFPVNPLIRFSRSQRAFTIVSENGKTSTILIRSASDPDRLRGLKVLSCWIDEAAFTGEYAWEIVQGRLADVDGPCWITTTPNGFNWVFELYDKARKGDRSTRVVHWPSTANRFISQEGIGRLEQSYDPRTHKQEVGAMFVRGRGLVYYPFKRSVHVRPWRFNPKLPLYVGQDFNVDPMATILMQPMRTTAGEDGLHVFATWRREDSDTFKLCVELHNFCEQHHLKHDRVTVFPDASGHARSTSGKSDFKIIREAGFNISAPPRNPFIKDRVNCVNGLLAPMASDGKRRPPRLLFDAAAEDVLDALEKQIWAPDSDPPVPDKTMGHDHFTDALGYPCWRLFPLRGGTVIGRRAESASPKAVPPRIRRSA